MRRPVVLLVSVFALGVGAMGGWGLRGYLDDGYDGLTASSVEMAAVRRVALDRGLQQGFVTDVDFRGAWCGGIVSVRDGRAVTFVVVGEDSGDAMARLPRENALEVAEVELRRDGRCPR